MTTLYVGNLPFSATEAEIRSLFEQHGKVDSVKIINDRETGKPRGFAFVDMTSTEAQAAYRALIDLENVGNEVRAGAWNGLGDILSQDKANAKNAEKLTEALFMYLRGVVEFGPAPGEGTGEYERALASSSRVFQQLSDLETDDARKKQNAQRSKQRLEQLRKEFPNSIYLKS